MCDPSLFERPFCCYPNHSGRLHQDKQRKGYSVEYLCRSHYRLVPGSIPGSVILMPGPQLYRERGMVVSFCSSHSEIKHTRPREVSANTVNPQSLELEAAVISESRVSPMWYSRRAMVLRMSSQVRFHGERHFWIIWGEGLLFAVGLAG